MADRVLRFAVGDAEGAHAATWRVWSPSGRGKSDVYLACRSLGGALKTSLHESGSWHVGFIRDYVEANLNPGDPWRDDPYLDQWPRPLEISRGVTLGYQIVVLPSAVAEPSERVSVSSIMWIPAPSPESAVEISLLLTSANAVVRGWPGIDSMGTQLVGSYALDNGETLWVVHRMMDTPPIGLVGGGTAHWFRSKGPDDLRGSNVGALVFGDAEDGRRVIVECGVRDSLAAI
jgi:hypothetical protein